ncbi:hypothetical protein EC988_003164, partial [Linderina pennispora]
MWFYDKAADILGRLERREGSIKNMTIGNRSVKPEEKRKMYALICETLKYASALSTVVERSGVLAAEKIKPRQALVMCHDMLLARGGLQHQGADKRLNHRMMKHKTRMAAEFAKLKVELNATCNADLVPENLRDNASTFRYVRVNLIKTTVDAVVKAFEEERYKLARFEDVGRDGLHRAMPPKARKFMRDPDLSDVLVFPPGTDLHDHPLYVNGSVILQDKASCMPAHVAQPVAGSQALDACAAPGNKTSHMVSLMHNKGRVFAFDMDRYRLDTLVKLTGNAGCKTITPECMSFLDVDPWDRQYAGVEYALLDPSCSGSGIVNRLDALVDSYIDVVRSDGRTKKDNEGARLSSLADFQVAIVLHAMKFPNVKRISYSTCSVHAEENEQVVARVLAEQDEFGLAPADHVVPTWPRRGLSGVGLTDAQAKCVVRTLPEDGTNGFFVAGFVRLRPAEPRKEAPGEKEPPVPKPIKEGSGKQSKEPPVVPVQQGKRKNPASDEQGKTESQAEQAPKRQATAPSKKKKSGRSRRR